jgi:GxxExxY protein
MMDWEGRLTTEDTGGTEEKKGKAVRVGTARMATEYCQNSRAITFIYLNPTEMRTMNEITGGIIEAAMKVHSVLGPGLLESAYEVCLIYELKKQGLHVAGQVALPVVYEDVRLDAGYRMDLVVDETVIVEIKAVDEIAPIHKAQLLSYLKLSGLKVGLLLNFNVAHLRDGIIRMMN